MHNWRGTTRDNFDGKEAMQAMPLESFNGSKNLECHVT